MGLNAKETTNILYRNYNFLKIFRYKRNKLLLKPNEILHFIWTWIRPVAALATVRELVEGE